MLNLTFKRKPPNKNQSLRQNISVLNKDLNLILDVLNEIQNKDDNIYRANLKQIHIQITKGS